MGVRMRHLKSGNEYDAQPSQVPFLLESEWEEIPGQQEHGDVWPAEVQRFEGQPPIRMHHPITGADITVAESAAPIHRANGWLLVEPVAEPEPEPAGVTFEGFTVEELRNEARARGLAVSGTKAELLGRLADTDQPEPVKEGVE